MAIHRYWEVHLFRYPRLVSVLLLLFVGGLTLTGVPLAPSGQAQSWPSPRLVVVKQDDVGAEFVPDDALRMPSSEYAALASYVRPASAEVGPRWVISGAQLLGNGVPPGTVEDFAAHFALPGLDQSIFRRVEGPPVGSKFEWRTGELRADPPAEWPLTVHLVAFFEAPFLGFAVLQGPAEQVSQEQTQAYGQLMAERMRAAGPIGPRSGPRSVTPDGIQAAPRREQSPWGSVSPLARDRIFE